MPQSSILERESELFERERKANSPLAKFRRNKTAVFGFVLITIILLFALFSPLFATHDPDELAFANAHKAPGTDGHFFGTDEFGRDLYSRIVYGARISMAVGFGATLIGALLGSFLGLLAGYGPRWQDSIIMRLMDGISAFPFILLAIFLMTIFGSAGKGLLNVIFAISIGNIPRFARIARGEAILLKNEEFVNAQRVLGASDSRILFQHILPNAISPIIVNATLGISNAIMAEAALGFLGMGVLPPVATWGNILRSGREFMNSSPHIAFFSGLFIMLTVLGFNLFGDGVRDVLDPKMKR